MNIIIETCRNIISYIGYFIFSRFFVKLTILVSDSIHNEILKTDNNSNMIKTDEGLQPSLHRGLQSCKINGHTVFVKIGHVPLDAADYPSEAGCRDYHVKSIIYIPRWRANETISYIGSLTSNKIDITYLKGNRSIYSSYEINRSVKLYYEPEVKKQIENIQMGDAVLLCGPPGVGKTTLLNWLIKKFDIKKIIVYHTAAFNDFDPPAPRVKNTLYLFDEFEKTFQKLITEKPEYMSFLQSIIDSPAQKRKSIFLFTCNSIETIQKFTPHLLRQGRMNHIIQINYPSLAVQLDYILNRYEISQKEAEEIIQEGLIFPEIDFECRKRNIKSCIS